MGSDHKCVSHVISRATFSSLLSAMEKRCLERELLCSVGVRDGVLHFDRVYRGAAIKAIARRASTLMMRPARKTFRTFCTFCAAFVRHGREEKGKREQARKGANSVRGEDAYGLLSVELLVRGMAVIT